MAASKIETDFPNIRNFGMILFPCFFSRYSVVVEIAAHDKAISTRITSDIRASGSVIPAPDMMMADALYPGFAIEKSEEPVKSRKNELNASAYFAMGTPMERKYKDTSPIVPIMANKMPRKRNS
jgi:hypothetical protein